MGRSEKDYDAAKEEGLLFRGQVKRWCDVYTCARCWFFSDGYCTGREMKVDLEESCIRWRKR